MTLLDRESSTDGLGSGTPQTWLWSAADTSAQLVFDLSLVQNSELGALARLSGQAALVVLPPPIPPPPVLLAQAGRKNKPAPSAGTRRMRIVDLVRSGGEKAPARDRLRYPNPPRIATVHDRTSSPPSSPPGPHRAREREGPGARL